MTFTNFKVISESEVPGLKRNWKAILKTIPKGQAMVINKKDVSFNGLAYNTKLLEREGIHLKVVCRGEWRYVINHAEEADKNPPKEASS